MPKYMNMEWLSELVDNINVADWDEFLRTEAEGGGWSDGVYIHLTKCYRNDRDMNN